MEKNVSVSKQRVLKEMFFKNVIKQNESAQKKILYTNHNIATTTKLTSIF